MFKKMALTMTLTLLATGVALAANYIEPHAMKEMLEKKQPVILVDIQPAVDFEKQHLPGSIETNAFPGKTDEEKKRLDKTLPVIKASKDPVVVVCPRGKGGAMNTYEYLKQQGVPEERMRILTGGIADWPFKELFVKGR